MTAVIWLVQILIYPGFKFIEGHEFVAFHKRHCDRISFLVTPMLLQPFATLMILLNYPSRPEWILHTGCITLIYAATAIFSVPEHHRLGKEKDDAAIHRLVKRNWIRTFLWSVQFGLILSRRFGLG